MTWQYCVFWLAVVGATALYLGDHLNTLAARLREIITLLEARK